MPYVATMNVPGYLPTADEPAVFGTAREAWEYLIDEIERGELAWMPDDLDDPEGPASRTPTALAMERHAIADDMGTVYGPSYLPTSVDEDTSTDLGLAYSVDYTDEPIGE